MLRGCYPHFMTLWLWNRKMNWFSCAFAEGGTQFWSPPRVLPALGLPLLHGSWGGFRTAFLPWLFTIHISSNRRNGMNIPSIYSVVYSCISVTFGAGPTSIDPLILPPSQPIWSHSHILLSKNFDPEGLIWNFPTCWVINGLTLVFSCLLPQYHCRDRNGTSHTHPEYFPV